MVVASTDCHGRGKISMCNTKEIILLGGREANNGLFTMGRRRRLLWSDRYFPLCAFFHKEEDQKKINGAPLFLLVNCSRQEGKVIRVRSC